MSGFVLCGTKNPVHAVTKFDAQLAIVEYKSIMCAGYTAVMHAHAIAEEVTLTVGLWLISFLRLAVAYGTSAGFTSQR